MEADVLGQPLDSASATAPLTTLAALPASESNPARRATVAIAGRAVTASELLSRLRSSTAHHAGRLRSFLRLVAALRSQQERPSCQTAAAGSGPALSPGQSRRSRPISALPRRRLNGLQLTALLAWGCEAVWRRLRRQPPPTRDGWARWQREGEETSALLEASAATAARGGPRRGLSLAPEPRCRDRRRQS